MPPKKLDRDNPLPLYSQLREILENAIQAGEFSPDQPLLSQRKMCEVFGVSRPIVIKVLEEMTTDGLLQSRRGSGTFVTKDAAEILRRRTESRETMTVGIGFLRYEQEASLATIQVLRAIQRLCDERGIATRLLGHAPARSTDTVQDVDGILIIDETRSGQVQRLETSGVPFVTLFAEYEGKEYYTVTNDAVSMGFQCAEYLILRGHRHIAFLTGPLRRPAGQCLAYSPAMIEGYRKALRKHEIRFRTGLVRHCDQYKESEAYHQTKELLDLACPPTAFITFDDILAVGAMRAVQEHSRRVPEDVAILGSGNILDSDFLSTLDRNVPQAVRLALNMLTNLVYHQPVDQRKLTIDTHLVIRKSIHEASQPRSSNRY